MEINLPLRVRFAIYVVFSVGSIVMTYLATVGVVHEPEMAAWTALTVFATGLAAVKTRPVAKG